MLDAELIRLRNRKAYTDGLEGENIAVSHGLKKTNDTVDGIYENRPAEVKTCRETIKAGKTTRRGRFKLEKEQHNDLVKRNGVYIFVVLGDNSYKLKIVEAKKVKYSHTITWTNLFDEKEGM